MSRLRSLMGPTEPPYLVVGFSCVVIFYLGVVAGMDGGWWWVPMAALALLNLITALRVIQSYRRLWESREKLSIARTLALTQLADAYTDAYTDPSVPPDGRPWDIS